ncbi:PfkB family carbohydrate kinase [Nocardioides speluncae]|uniref:PfkB family carbohydrate kinase n=1 Tax=Nocardioides speluncae TaxID=2670337 RepID=UPI001F0BFC59|nr:PfkB family carbohydrate kinase [Nocardioides speluncae]
MRDVALVVGESLIDVMVRGEERQEYAGGSAANVAVALARLGRPVVLATRYADDAHGRLLAEQHAAAGLTVIGGRSARTSTALARIGADGSASYQFEIVWDLDGVELSPDTRPVAVHACSLGTVLQPGADAVVSAVGALRESAMVSYDVNTRPSITGTGPDVVARVEAMVDLADVVKASDEDLTALYPERSWRDSAGALLARGPAAVVVTRGGEGATVLASSGVVDVAVPPVEVVDTIGAGDTFGAATLHALWSRDLLGADRRPVLAALSSDEWHEVVAYAARAAAVTVSRPGADPPYAHEL